MGKPTKNCRNVTKEIPHFPGDDDETPTKYRTKAGDLWIELDEVFQSLYDKYTVDFEKQFQGFKPEEIKAHPLAAHFLINLRRKK